MSNGKITPLPWLIVKPEKYGPNQEDDRLIHTEDGKHIAEVFQYQNYFHQNGPSIANAEFIVRACNSHYELLEACKRTVEMFDKNSTAMNELPYTYTRLKQVIAKAEGKE